MVKWRLYIEKWQGEKPSYLGFTVTEHSDESLLQAIKDALDDCTCVRVTITRLEEA